MKYLKYTLAFFTLILFSACSDSPITPIGGEGEQPGLKAANFGLVEVTISGIGTEKMTASAQPYVSNIAKNLSQPSGSSDPNDDGTIKMESISNGSFTTGTRGTSDGWRYLYATFKVRNATQNNFSYFDTRQNLTFLAVDTDDTYGVTAVSMLRNFSGDELTTNAQTIAENTIPTGAVQQGVEANVKPRFADVLQVYTETDLDNFIPPTTVNNLFPYGFVTHSPNVTPNSRDILPPPNANSFNGVVTFAFKMPLQADANSDPFEITAIFLPVDDSETHITQSLEEETAAGRAMLKKRAAYLTPSYVTILPGSTYRGPSDLMCIPVRIAGTQSDIVTTLFEPPPGIAGGFLTPNPYDQDANNISSNSNIAVFLNAPVTNANARTFVVHGGQSGTQFIGEEYIAFGSLTGAPQGNFFAGEIVDVTLIKGFGDCSSHVVRYRVEATGNGNFGTATSLSASNLGTVALGDMNGDNKLDLVTLASGLGGFSLIRVELGDGAGNFNTIYFGINKYITGSNIKLGDINEDGTLDVVTSSFDNVSVSIGKGDGTFFTPKVIASLNLSGDADFDIGDVDGNGTQDIIAGSTDAIFGGSTIEVFLSDGTGSFYAAPGSPMSFSNTIKTLKTGDLDNDGDLDLLGGYGSNQVGVLLGDNTGAFSAPTTVSNVGFTFVDIELADLNGDGILDLIGREFGSTSDPNTTNSTDISVAFGDGNGGFGTAATYTAGNDLLAFDLGDIDGDDDLDILVTDRDNKVNILLNSAGVFSPSVTTVTVGDRPDDIELGDINNNGALDIITANGDSDDISVVEGF